LASPGSSARARARNPAGDLLGADLEQQLGAHQAISRAEATEAALTPALEVLVEGGPRRRALGGRQEREAQARALLDEALGAALGQTAHAADEALALGDADGAARVEEVEGVRALHAVVVRGQHRALGEQALGLLSNSSKSLKLSSASESSKLKRENSTSLWWCTWPYLTPSTQVRS
jgi:hypothetical protein